MHDLHDKNTQEIKVRCGTSGSRQLAPIPVVWLITIGLWISTRISVSLAGFRWPMSGQRVLFLSCCSSIAVPICVVVGYISPSLSRLIARFWVCSLVGPVFTIDGPCGRYNCPPWWRGCGGLSPNAIFVKLLLYLSSNYGRLTRLDSNDPRYCYIVPDSSLLNERGQLERERSRRKEILFYVFGLEE